jgi:hypothetical protein
MKCVLCWRRRFGAHHTHDEYTKEYETMKYISSLKLLTLTPTTQKVRVLPGGQSQHIKLFYRTTYFLFFWYFLLQ